MRNFHNQCEPCDCRMSGHVLKGHFLMYFKGHFTELALALKCILLEQDNQ